MTLLYHTLEAVKESTKIGEQKVFIFKCYRFSVIHRKTDCNSEEVAWEINQK